MVRTAIAGETDTYSDWYRAGVTESEIVEFVTGLAGVKAEVASEENGAPEEAWGDIFFSVGGPKFPFITLVKRDQPGDESSNLDREGVFRLNINIGRAALADLFPEGADHDPAALDRLFPHPVYAGYGYVSVLNPEVTADRVRELILAAHERASGTPPTWTTE